MKRLSILTFILFSINIIGQEFSDQVNWGEFIKINKKDRSPEVIGQDGEHIFTLRFKKNKSYIERYNLESLRFENMIQLNLRSNENKKLSIKYAVMLDNQPVLISYLYDRKSRNTFYYAHLINSNNLSVRKTISLDKVFKSKGIKIDISNDQNLFLSIFQNHHEIDRKNKHAPIKPDFSGKLFDKELEVLEELEFEIPIPGFVTLKREVGDDGRIYLLGYQRIIQKNNKRLIFNKEAVAGDSYLITIDPESGDMESVPINIESGKRIEMMSFNILDNGNIQVCGIMGKNEVSNIDGAFTMIYTNNLEEVNQTNHSFPVDFITQTWSDKTKKKAKKNDNKNARKGKAKENPQFYNYYIDYVVQREDGSVLMLAEQYYVIEVVTTTTNSQGQMQTKSTFHYYYNDIIAVSFDKNGDFEWEELIKKKQHSVNDGGYYSSYFVVNQNDEISMIYNDKARNTDEVNDANSSRKERRAVVGLKATLDRDGKLTKKILFEFPEENRMRIVPKKCEYTGDGIVFIYARNKKGHKLGTITLD